jgi:ADP-heptose:LPS heptosyltransferase
MHVSAGNPFRKWPAESFAAVAASLIEREANRRVILVSGPSETEAAAEIAARAHRLLHDTRPTRGEGTRPRVEWGEYDLAELRALVMRAAVYIGGDSGPLHVAATTRTPIVELLGPTLPERSRPWRDDRWFTEIVEVGTLPCRPCQQRACAPGDFRCLTGIAPDRVIAGAERAMKSGSRGKVEDVEHVKAVASSMFPR